MKFNLDENGKFVQMLGPDSYTVAAEAFTSGVDTQGFDEALIIVNVKSVGAGASFPVRIQESADNAVADPYADVVTAANGFAGTIIVDTNTAIPALFFGRIDLAKRKRWLRAGYTAVVGTTKASIEIILTGQKYKPQASGQGEAGYPTAGATAAGRCFQV